jgi:release factor glutamine methyltransferase
MPTPPPLADIVARLRAAGCVFAEDEARLLLGAARTPEQLAGLVARREAGEPIEYILGWVEFCGLRIAVQPGVFVPRRRTEFLARQAAEWARSGDVVVDLCCGAGAVGAVVADVIPGVEVHAVDIEPAAVRCARRNLGDNVYQGDLYEPLPAALRGRVAVLTANAPYVPTEALATMPAEARLHEPRVALDGGADGLDVLRRVAAGAPEWLVANGRLLVESSSGQAGRVADTMAAAGLRPQVLRQDELGATVVRGVKPPTHRRA